MTLNDAVRAWVSQPTDYSRGLSLLRDTGYDGPLLGILSRGEDRYTHPKLEQLLSSWLSSSVGSVEPVAAPVVVSPPAEAASRPSPVTPSVTEPQVRAQIQRQAYSLMDTRSELKARLRATADDADRQGDRMAWAISIKQLTTQIDYCYEQLEQLAAHGYLPPQQLVVEVGVAQLNADRLNVRTYVSRYRKRFAQAKTDEARAEALAKLQHYETELNRLETALRQA